MQSHVDKLSSSAKKISIQLQIKLWPRDFTSKIFHAAVINLASIQTITRLASFNGNSYNIFADFVYFSQL